MRANSGENVFLQPLKPHYAPLPKSRPFPRCPAVAADASKLFRAVTPYPCEATAEPVPGRSTPRISPT